MSTESLIPSGATAPTLWALPAGRALTLSAGRGGRVIQVRQGRVWLTRRGHPDQPAHDCWVRAGERIAIPADDEVVVEGWPRASFELLEPAQPIARPRFNDWIERLHAWRAGVA